MKVVSRDLNTTSSYFLSHCVIHHEQTPVFISIITKHLLHKDFTVRTCMTPKRRNDETCSNVAFLDMLRKPSPAYFVQQIFLLRPVEEIK